VVLSYLKEAFTALNVRATRPRRVAITWLYEMFLHNEDDDTHYCTKHSRKHIKLERLEQPGLFSAAQKIGWWTKASVVAGR
jgi:hypothetical protein